MSLVTISDHNTIDGALEIAHLPKTFVSEEITTYFPESGCKIHVLALNINERQHRDIQEVRPDIFDLVPYLRSEKIVHAVAHPLYSSNDRLTLEHFERLLLLFDTFELNGAREGRQNQVLEWILSQLGPRDMEALSDRHNLEPSSPEPWRKSLIGGSDDHSSLNITRMHTEVKGANNLKEFMEGIQQGRCKPRGRASSPLTLSHNLYSIAYQFYKNKFNLTSHIHKDIFLQFLDRFLNGRDKESGVLSRIYFLWNHHKPAKVPDQDSSLQHLLRREGQALIWNDPELMHIVKRGNGGKDALDRKWYEFVNRMSNKVLVHFTDHLIGHLAGANFLNLFSSLGSAGALYSILAPYFVSFSVFTKDREITEQIRARFGDGPAAAGEAARGHSVAHFTDTFYEVNGVALTLQQQARLAVETGKSLTIITCDAEKNEQVPGVKNFEPIGVAELPEYPEQKLFYPPLLEMIRYCYEEDFTRINTSTPGPIGLAALAISRILKLPISGLYHTSLPQYAAYLTGDDTIEDLMWKYVLWYYEQLDLVFVPSKSTGRELEEKGLSPNKIRLFPRGIDIKRFHPSKRDLGFVRRYTDSKRLKLLYVGRISREKNLPLLVDVFKSLSTSTNDVSLMVAGDGPYLEEMREALKGTACTFTGYLKGEPLATLYASCDLFVFPSTTDTFGNVVLEAQASGLPVVVTDEGGPQENLLPGRTGLVVPGKDVRALEEAIRSLAGNPIRLKEMGKAARRYMEGRSFEAAFDETWRMYEEPQAADRQDLPLDLALAV
jgi:glycosyltransferase involved in cell wall biosynthesis